MYRLGGGGGGGGGGGVQHRTKVYTTCQENKPSTSMTLVACESKLLSVVRSSMYPCPGNWVAIGRAILYYARAAHAFSVGIKCLHYMYLFFSLDGQSMNIQYKVKHV